MKELKSRMKKTGYKNRILAAMLLIPIFFGACGFETQAPAASPDVPGNLLTGEGTASIEWMEQGPVIAYEMPEMLPAVLVNQIGYTPEAVKTAVFTGNTPAAGYEVTDALSGECVFLAKDTDQGYLDFSDFKTEGTYYLFDASSGRSYEFVIQQGLYEELASQLFDTLEKRAGEVDSDSVAELCSAMSILLLSYELYGPVCEEQDYEGAPRSIRIIKQYAESMIAMQDTRSGAVMEGERPLLLQTAWLAAFLAKFSYSYQKFDSTYANACLQAADRAWQYVRGSLDEAEQEVFFFAAAELYRAAGQNKYQKEITALSGTLKADAANIPVVLGTMTYAMTKRKVDRTLCERLMEVLFVRGQECAQRVEEDRFLVGSRIQEGDVAVFLWDTVVIASANYVITNQEYGTLLERYYYYLAGENEANCCYIPDERADNAAESTLEESYIAMAEYMMLLCEMVSHEGK